MIIIVYISYHGNRHGHGGQQQYYLIVVTTGFIGWLMVSIDHVMSGDLILLV